MRVIARTVDVAAGRAGVHRLCQLRQRGEGTAAGARIGVGQMGQKFVPPHGTNGTNVGQMGQNSENKKKLVSLDFSRGSILVDLVGFGTIRGCS